MRWRLCQLSKEPMSSTTPPPPDPDPASVKIRHNQPKQDEISSGDIHVLEIIQSRGKTKLQHLTGITLSVILWDTEKCE